MPKRIDGSERPMTPEEKLNQAAFGKEESEYDADRGCRPSAEDLKESRRTKLKEGFTKLRGRKRRTGQSR